MPKKKKLSVRRLFSNRRLISVEAILLVGLLESLIENYVMALSAPEPLKTLFVMLFIAGAFGVLMSVVVFLTRRSLSKGQQVLKLLPLPTSHLVLHAVILIGIFWLYTEYY